MFHLPKSHFSKPQFGDIIAGVSVAGLLLPESVAYASIAGLSAIHAMLAALIGILIYAVVGSSRQAIVSPTSSSAAIFASAAAMSMAAGSISTDKGFALVIVTGVLFVIVGWLKGGFIGSFISRPVMQGFAWSLAITIMLKQIPHILGLETHAKSFFPLLLEISQSLSKTILPSAILGTACFLLWRLLAYLKIRSLPPSIVVLILGTIICYGLGLAQHEVKTVGLILLAGLSFHLPDLSLNEWLQICELAPAMLLIIFAESWESVKMLANNAGESINSNRELMALGVANLVCGLVGALPVGAGYSASNASLSGGAKGKWAGIFTAVTIALLLAFGRDWLAELPIPVLSAVVLGILSKHFLPDEVIEGLKFGKDAWLAVVCIVAVLLFGVMFGMVVLVGLSMLLALYRFSKPLISELGQLPDSHDYVNVAMHPQAKVFANLLIVRVEEPLFFANAERIFEDISQMAKFQQAKGIIINLEMSRDLDATTLFELKNFIEKVKKMDKTLALACLKDTPRQAIAKLAEPNDFDKNKHNMGQLIVPAYYSVDDAVQALQK